MDEKFTRSYFDSAYGPYYRLRNPRHKWLSFLAEIKKHISAGSLLDIGCAYGLFLQEASHSFDCMGVDISLHAVAEARSTLSKEIDVFVGAVGSLHLENRYDLITCFDVLEHTRDLGEALDNIQDLLKDGGILALTVPVYDGPLGWMVDMLDRDETHNYRRSREFWLAEVSKRFAVLDYVGIWRYFFFNRFYLNVLSKSTRRITPAVMILAKKGEER
ncbi:MAG: class I SAM-dependent methyltransferase [Chloroflexi bacterium]|nr:class I SAM-dependent methyltransferase [Chloroflexota bacterium]